MAGLLQFFRSKRGFYLIFGFVVAVVCWGMLKGCSRAHMRTVVYTVGIDRSWYPLLLYGKEKNLLAFTDELLEAVSAESGIRFDLIETGTANLVENLDSGIYDAVVSSKPPTHQNMVKYNFSDPIYLVGPVLVVRTDSTIRSLDQLGGRFLGIRRGFSLAFDKPLPHANIISYDNMTVALSDLEDNKIDALIMDSLFAYVQIQGIYTGKIKIVTGPLSQEGLRLMTLYNSREEEMLQAFNQTLKVLHENGQYHQLLQRWGLFDPNVN